MLLTTANKKAEHALRSLVMSRKGERNTTTSQTFVKNLMPFLILVLSAGSLYDSGFAIPRRALQLEWQ